MLAAAVAFLPSAGLCAGPEGSEAPEVDQGALKLGLMVALQLEEMFGTVEDEAELERLNRVGVTVAVASDNARGPFSFAILKDEHPNALALPGGFIYVTSGLLDLGLDDDEIAPLLGHEIAHITRKHLLKRRTASILLSILSVIVLMNMPGPGEGEPVEIDGKKVSHAEAAMMARSLAVQLSQALLEMGYSREHEREADKLGHLAAAKAGYDPDGAFTLFEKMRRKNEEDPYLLEGLFRTHPDMKERMRSRKAASKTVPHSRFPASPARARALYQRMLYREGRTFSERDRRDRRDRRDSRKAAEFLYRRALWVFADGELADDALLRLLLFREEDMMEEVSQVREPALVLKELERILKRYPGSDRRGDMVKMQERYARESGERYAWYERKMAEGPQPLDVYQGFLKWYPESPLRETVLLGLARSLVMASDYDAAAGRYVEWLGEFPGAGQADAVRGELGSIVAKVKSPETLLQCLDLVAGTVHEGAARERIAVVLREVSGMKDVRRIQAAAKSEDARRMASERLGELALDALFRARTFEMLEDRDRARELYKDIVENAGDTEWGMQARQALKDLEGEG